MFLKVSVDQLSQSLYIPINNRHSAINNQLGGGADNSSVFRGKAPEVRMKLS